MALFYILLIHYSLPLNHDFTELVFCHTSSASDMANKMNHFSLYPLLENVLNYTMLGTKIKLYSSKYLTQFNPEVKNNLPPLFLQESPAKDDLLQFKYLKLSYRDTEANSWLATYLLMCSLLFLCKRASWFLFN